MKKEPSMSIQRTIQKKIKLGASAPYFGINEVIMFRTAKDLDNRIHERAFRLWLKAWLGELDLPEKDMERLAGPNGIPEGAHGYEVKNELDD